MSGERNTFSGPAKIVWSQQLDPADDQAVNSRLLVRRQKMHRSQKCYIELAELTVDDFWQIADADDQELRRLAHRSRRGTLELGAEDNDGLSQQACTALADE